MLPTQTFNVWAEKKGPESLKCALGNPYLQDFKLEKMCMSGQFNCNHKTPKQFQQVSNSFVAKGESDFKAIMKRRHPKHAETSTGSVLGTAGTSDGPSGRLNHSGLQGVRTVAQSVEPGSVERKHPRRQIAEPDSSHGVYRSSDMKTNRAFTNLPMIAKTQVQPVNQDKQFKTLKEQLLIEQTAQRKRQRMRVLGEMSSKEQLILGSIPDSFSMKHSMYHNIIAQST